jgi:hypothetical protein
LDNLKQEGRECVVEGRTEASRTRCALGGKKNTNVTAQAATANLKHTQEIHQGRYEGIMTTWVLSKAFIDAQSCVHAFEVELVSLGVSNQQLNLAESCDIQVGFPNQAISTMTAAYVACICVAS